MSLDKKKLKQIKGDASFRVFYRKKNDKKNSIIVYSRKKKLKNLLIYDSINKLLIKNKILAPKLYDEKYKKGYMEIEDFGDKTVFKVLKKNSNQLHEYKKTVNLLHRIQLIKETKIKNFKNKNYNIPQYNNDILFKEAQLFCNWYVKKKISKHKKTSFNMLLKKQIRILISKLQLKNDTFVHRDFHVSNIMKVENEYALIDNQDALIGNKAYDLASLIDDVRFQTSEKLKKKIYNYYLESSNKKINKSKFKNDFEILSVLRNLKIIGIFTRLAIRDDKKKYLNLIPYAWRLIELRLGNNPIFKDLRGLIDNNNLKQKIK
jgi:N-acetylmuramate 1-kinase